MDKFTANQIESLREVFSGYDKSGDGEIDVDELYEAISSAGYKCTRNDIKHFLETNDIDHNGTLDFEEFVTLLHKFSKA